MTSALSPREIQSRLRAGASVAEVAAEAGVDVERISGFALPVMAERSHVTRTALAASVRRRGDGSGHRRLGDLIHERLLARGLDADTVEWDSWRQSDLRWKLVGLLEDQAASRAAEFVYDPKGRFSVADNADARWMIGEELPGVADDPDNENTIDFHDEFALVRATADGAASGTAPSGRPGDDVPHADSPYEASAHTSELDELYDMLSGVSEDSVRIYLGLDEVDEEDSTETAKDELDNDSPDATAPDALPLGDTSEDAAAASIATSDGAAGTPQDPDTPGTTGSHVEAADTPATAVATPATEDTPEEQPAGPLTGHGEPSPKSEDGGVGTDEPSTAPDIAREEPAVSAPVAPQQPDRAPVAPEQDALVPEVPSSPPKRKPARKRASIPSWDEIMFGGPTPS